MCIQPHMWTSHKLVMTRGKAMYKRQASRSGLEHCSAGLRWVMMRSTGSHLFCRAPCQDGAQSLQQVSVGGHEVAVIAPFLL